MAELRGSSFSNDPLLNPLAQRDDEDETIPYNPLMSSKTVVADKPATETPKKVPEKATVVATPAPKPTSTDLFGDIPDHPILSVSRVLVVSLLV